MIHGPSPPESSKILHCKSATRTSNIKVNDNINKVSSQFRMYTTEMNISEMVITVVVVVIINIHKKYFMA